MNGFKRRRKMPENVKNSLEDLKTDITNALKNLVTLEIITVVGQVEFKTDANKNKKGLPDIDITKNPKAILTKIDLLQGDIKTIYDPEFVTGQYQSLKDFHKSREDQGYQIIKDNIDALKNLYNLVKSGL